MVKWLFLLVFSICCSLVAHAQQRNLNVGATSGGSRVALVIGNDAYTRVPALRNARTDAQAMAAALRATGFDVILRTDLDDRALRAAVRDFTERLSGGSEAVFYFAGHGVQLGAANYLLPVNIAADKESQVRDDGLPLQRVLDDLTEQKVRFSIAIIDACRDNPFPRVAGRSIGTSRGLAPTSPATGQMVLFSAGTGQSALDRLGPSDRDPNGLFTRVLLKQMQQPGVPVDQVLRNVREEVVTLAKGVGHEQVPAIYDQVVGRFYFRPPSAGQVASTAPSAAAVAAQSAADDRALWESVKDARNPDEIRAYLERFPSGLFAGVAGVRLRALQAQGQPSASTGPVTTVASIAPTTAIRASAPFRDCDQCPQMVIVPAGSFMMGSPGNERQRSENEGPQRLVTVASFAVGKFEVTQEEWEACVKDAGCPAGPLNFGKENGSRAPVTFVAWNDAQRYVAWLVRKTGRKYRLLSEAEWEYAARAGTTTAFSFGGTLSPQAANFDSIATYAGSASAPAKGKPADVGSYATNAFGLHDMHGNALEWTEDCWVGSYEGAPASAEARIINDCYQRVLRGGSYGTPPWDARSASRTAASPRNVSSGGFNSGAGGYGFRVARDS